MGIIQRFKDKTTNRKQTVTQETNGQIYVNALCSNYENFFAQVRPLIDEMKTVIPYGVGRNGARLADVRTPELTVLMAPNYSMGWAEFMDSAFATWLTEEELNIHVHKNGNRIIGYTILPVGCRSINNLTGGYRFDVYTETGLEVLTEEEVMTLRFSRSPRNIDKGVSPATSAFTAAQIDDLMMQYQKYFLANGAIPASITTIRASSKEKYEQTRRELESGLKGAKNANKTVYVWRQYLPTGEEQDQVEVKTIQGPNSTLALKELNSIISDRLNKAVGVSNFIMGDDSSAKYDNAELSDYQFTKRRVYPALLSFWGQFQHELDRITGGLGYAIQFDLEFPELTDRLKTQAETAKIQTETLTSMISAGARPSAAVEALKLPETWLPVADGIYSRVLSAEREANVLPAPLENKNVDKQSKDSTSQFEPKQETLRACDCHNTTHDEYGYRPVFTEEETIEKKIYDQLMKIVEAATEGLDIPEEEVRKVVDELLMGSAEDGANQGAKVISGLAFGKEATDEIKEVLENDGYHLSEDFENRLDARTAELIDGLSNEAKDVARATFTAAQEEGLSASEIKTRLAEAMPRYRAELIARNETVNAFRSGRLENDKYLQEKYSLKIGVVWRCTHDHKTCPVCEAMDGKMVALGEAFPTVEVEQDGKMLTWTHDKWNDEGQSPNAHCNCRCYFDEVVL